MEDAPGVRTRFQKSKGGEQHKFQKGKPPQHAQKQPSGPSVPSKDQEQPVIKDAAGNIVECDSCKSVGIPKQNHFARDCRNLLANIESLVKKSVDPATQQSNTNSGKQYVPPSGTSGQARSALSRDPTSGSIQFATNMFGPSATTGFGMSAMDNKQIPGWEYTKLPPLPRDEAPETSRVQSWGYRAWNLPWATIFRVMFMIVGLVSCITTAYSVTLGMLSTVSVFSTTISATLALPFPFPMNNPGEPQLSSV